MAGRGGLPSALRRWRVGTPRPALHTLQKLFSGELQASYNQSVRGC